MPNGKPGDHPYTDIVIHGANVYGDDIDDLVREMHHLKSSDLIRDRVSALLWDHNPWFSKDINRQLLRQELLKLKTEAED